MPAKARKTHPRAAVAKALVRKAMRPRAIDTSDGGFELVRAIYEQGRSDERRAMAKKGAAARKSKQPLFTPKLKRLRLYAKLLRDNEQFWKHPQAKDNLLMLQKALVDAGIKGHSKASIRKDLAALKKHAEETANQPARPPSQRRVKVPAQ